MEKCTVKACITIELCSKENVVGATNDNILE